MIIKFIFLDKIKKISCNFLRKGVTSLINKTSEGKTSEGKTSEGKTSEGKTSEGKTSEGKTSEGKTSEGKGTVYSRRRKLYWTLNLLREKRRRFFILRKKKWLSALAAAAMMLTLIPISAFAQEAAPENTYDSIL